MASAKSVQGEAQTEEPTLKNWEFDKPKKGTFALIKVRTATKPIGADGEPFAYPLLWVTEVNSGEQYTIHAFPEVLRSELKRLAPAIGDIFTIDYQGLRETKSGRKARVFDVTGGSGEETVNWDSIPF